MEPMKAITDTIPAIFNLTENEKDAVSINIDHYIKNHIREGGAHQSNMAARREVCNSTDVGNLTSDQVSVQS